ncbi:MAG TPA: metallophosphoesterase family protein [Ktedonobacteraceae bacterium]|nr:metallophosphoesterase family protein [Ktedonobacteraceae bacterium]
MKVAAIYDIHGNLPALEAVLAAIDQALPDLIVVGGDIVSGPMPRAVLERLMTRGNQVRFIRGNADREVVAAFDGLPLPANLPEEVREVTTWTAHQLERSHRDFLAGLPEQVSLNIDGLGDVLFCHGSPRSDEEMMLVTTPEARLREMIAAVRQDVVVCGHTHMQFDRRIDGTRVINAGSVGMPYGEPGAYWLLLGPKVAPQRTLYDLEQAAASIRATSYPLTQDFADNNVINPASEAEALSVFEQIAAQS